MYGLGAGKVEYETLPGPLYPTRVLILNYMCSMSTYEIWYP